MRCAGVVLAAGVPILASCAAKVVSPTAPIGQLSCSAGEAPVARRYYDGQFEWTCGPSPCSADKEAVWKPISGSEKTAGLWGLPSSAGVQKVDFTCAGHCDSGQPRLQNGKCPGNYALSSRFDGNTLIITARIDRKPIQGVRINIDHEGLRDVSGITDQRGEVRFDMVSEPFRHVLEEGRNSAERSFRSGGGIGGMLRADWETVGAFKDGASAKATILVGNSKLYKDALQVARDQGQKEETERQKKLTDECTANNAASCLELARLLQDKGRGPDAVRIARHACELGSQEACEAIRPEAPPTAAGGTNACDGCESGASEARRSRCGSDGNCLMHAFQKDKACRDQQCPGW